MSKTTSKLAIPTSVKERRIARGWGQEVLAEKAGLSTTTIHNLESGKNGFTDKSLAALSAALGCTPAELLTPADHEQPEKIRTEPEILAMLARIDGLSDTDITVAFGVIRMALSKQGGSEREGSRDRFEPASRRHATEPSR